MPASRLKMVQLGKESAWGTPVAATVRIPTLAEPSVNPNTTLWQSEFYGFVGPGETMSVEAIDWSGSFPFAATYEFVPYLFDSLWGAASPSGSGPYTYSYTAPYTAMPSNPRSYTIEYGAPGAMYRLLGGLTTRIGISGEVGQPWQVENDFIGKKVEPLASAANLALLATKLIRMADTRLFIDNWGGTIGSTQINAALIAFSLEFTSTRHLKRFAGDVHPSAWGDNTFGGSLSLTLEFTPNVKSQLDALLNGLTSRLFRIEATTGDYRATIDFAGAYEGNPSLFSDRDGNVTIELAVVPRYSPDLGYWAKAEFVNNLNALP